MQKRSISESFLNNLKAGLFKSIVDIVRIDPSLDLEMRGDTVMVYYRGGKTLTIHDPDLYPNMKEAGFLTGLDPKYSYKENSKQAIPLPHSSSILDYFAESKHIIDNYEWKVKEHLGEKEIQQRIVSENNSMVNADETDFFIADMEWAENSVLEGRADLIAFHWGHMEHRRKKLTMYLIEVKQGCDAIRTRESTKKEKVSPGLKKHQQDFYKLQNEKSLIKELKDDMLEVLRQKYCLGLVKGLDHLFSQVDGKVTTTGISIEDEIHFVFLLANYLHYSDNLKNELEDMPDDSYFFVSSFLGYGLFKDLVLTKAELKKHYPMMFKI